MWAYRKDNQITPLRQPYRSFPIAVEHRVKAGRYAQINRSSEGFPMKTNKNLS